MKLFVYEYACALGRFLSLRKSIRIEGRAMLSAVVEDFQRLPGVEVLTLLDQPPESEEAAFKAHAAAADWSLIIAPEFDHLLLDRCRWVLEAGGRLLGPSPETVRLTADKWATYRLLSDAGVPTPETWLASDPPRPGVALAACLPVLAAPLADELPVPPHPPGPFVIKPRFGAGSQDIRLQSNLEAIDPDSNMLVQEFVPGVPVSIAFLTGPAGWKPLLPGYQTLSNDGRFAYLGGRIPLPLSLAKRAEELARRSLHVLPQLTGYVGVDLVMSDLGEPAAQDRVIEINPRLTTSYVGLRALAVDNLAAAMLQVALGETIELRWKAAAAVFEPNGAVTLLSA